MHARMEEGEISRIGLGFFSAFLAADCIDVTSRHSNDDQYVWDSEVG